MSVGLQHLRTKSVVWRNDKFVTPECLVEPQNYFIKHSYAELLRSRDRIDQSSFQVIIKNLSEMEAHPEAAALEADAFVYDGMKKAQLEKKQVMPKEKS